MTREFIPVRIAVLTVSDTRTRETDKSGDTLAERIASAGHILADRDIVADDVALIRARMHMQFPIAVSTYTYTIHITSYRPARR